MKITEYESKCTGCSACMASCPKTAISMVQNDRGFYVPNIDENLCTNCGICAKVCPLMEKVSEKKIEYKAYYQYSMNKEEIKKSTSGGAFFLLAKIMLERGGMVCGCVWDEEYRAHHVLTDDINEVCKMRGSKYVQSDMRSCYAEIKKVLVSGREVLFCGTGCQTTGLINYVGEHLRTKLICVSLICGGVPSPKVWKAYKEAIEKKESSRIIELNMRSKNNGWYVPELYVKFQNGTVIQENLLQGNLYGTNFNEGLFINDECMQCSFKLDEVRSDIILADHWGIDKKMLVKCKNLGASSIITLTERGDEMIRLLEKISHVESGNVDDIIRSHGVLTKNHKYNPNREEFFADLGEDNILELFQKYYKKWEKEIGRSPIIPLLFRLKLYNRLFVMKKLIKGRK